MRIALLLLLLSIGLGCGPRIYINSEVDVPPPADYSKPFCDPGLLVGPRYDYFYQHGPGPAYCLD